MRDPQRAQFQKLLRKITAVDLAFISKELRTTCENASAARLELGAIASDSLKHRLADIRAATSTFDLIVGRPRFLEDTVDHMVVDLADGYRMVFCANHRQNPTKEGGKLDWQKISRVKILRIEKTLS